MRSFLKISLLVTAMSLAGCATVSDPVTPVENAASIPAQAEAAKAAAQVNVPTLKRKIALGRITNETVYGRSLIRTEDGDPLGKQVSDMLAKDLTASGHFVVLERTDITSLNKEAAFSGNAMQRIGADVLVIGSITEFGRKTVGKSGFLSSTKKQVAYANMDVRLVDTTTGQIIFSASGAGEASSESGNVLGWGSNRSGYDGTLGDKAISLAVSEVVNKLVSELADRPWNTYFLSLEKGALAISGGASQGLKPGTMLSVTVAGKKVKSQQTGFLIQLPGKKIATIEVTQNFGDTPETEGSIVRVVKGSLGKYKISELQIKEVK